MKGGGKFVIAGIAVFLALVLALVLLPGAQHPRPADRLRPGSVPARYQPWVLAAGALCPQVSPPLIAAQLDTESGWRPDALSPAGARGIAQFLPATWPAYGRDDDGDGQTGPDDPEDAIMAMGRYDCALAAQLAHLPGNPTAAMLAAYNAGPAPVLRHRGIPPYPETQHYVRTVLSRIPRYTDHTRLDAAATGFGTAVVSAATRWLGTPYSWGGGGPLGPTRGIGRGAATIGFDCSGLVLHAVWQASAGRVQLPHLAAAQVQQGRPVQADQMLPGDVIGIDHRRGAGISHIVIYVGAGNVVHAPRTGEVVRIAPLAGFRHAAWTIRRYP
jgi:cell wall-associated NlpC family hydrolase